MIQKQKIEAYKFISRSSSLDSQANHKTYQRQKTHKNIHNYNKNQRNCLIFTISIYLFLMVWPFYLQPEQYTIAIVGTNDLHGQAFPTILQRSDTKQQYKYGGLVYMANMIQTLTKQYNGNVIYLDGGDQFQGGVQASKLVSSGNIINDFYKIAGLKGSSIGNHQFDFGPKFLIQFLRNRQSVNLAANLKSQLGQSNFLPNHKPSMLIRLPNGIKIGVIGLATLQTLYTTAGFTSKLFPPYKFLPYKDIIIKQSNFLRGQGANAVILVSHIGDACNSDKTNMFHYINSLPEDCPPDQITKLINQLPQGTLNGIIQGHRHSFVHRFHKGVPYMGSINGGYYFNIMYLKFDSYGRLKNSSIEGPIPVCQKVFENIGRCNYLTEQQLNSSGSLVNWKFHNQPVKAHRQLQSVYRIKYEQKMGPFYQQLVRNQVHLYRRNYKQYQLANLFTNLLAQCSQNINTVVDFSVINTGIFRTEWTPGVIQYQHFYNMFPFDNLIQVFQITGQQLIQTMKIVQGGARYMNCWNLDHEVQYNVQDGTHRVISIKFGDGTQIQNNRIYRGVSVSYLIQGGDQFNLAINKTFNPKNIKTIGQFRQVLKPYLKRIKVIKKNSLIDANKPRLKINIINKLNNDNITNNN